MFSKSKKSKIQDQVSTPRTVPSIISSDLHIVGDLESAGEVQIDGQVSGDIRAKVLLIGESAVIKGEIFADTVRVHGRVDGQIKAKFVNLAKTAHVVGDILHENLSIQEGAFLEGHIMHMSEADVKAMDVANGRIVEAKPAETKPVEARPADGKAGEDRVNLVVKAGATHVSKSPPTLGVPGGVTAGAAPKAASGS
jgi:cytoskeletal protein CcmA (bactofilin family)